MLQFRAFSIAENCAEDPSEVAAAAEIGQACNDAAGQVLPHLPTLSTRRNFQRLLDLGVFQHPAPHRRYEQQRRQPDQ